MFRFQRLLTIYAIAIPLALMLGWLAATPDNGSIATIGLVLFLLVLPLLMQHCHWLLIVFWNSAFIANFLPGQLPFWVMLSYLTLGLGVVRTIMSRRAFLRVPEMAKPLTAFVVVVLLTAKARGGLGLHSFGSSTFGGKNYFYVGSAVVGYLALISQPVPLTERVRTMKWYFGSAVSFALTNLSYTLGPAFYIVYYFVSTDFAGGQAAADYTAGAIKRYGGYGPAAAGLMAFVLGKWGFMGLLDWTKPWRLLLFAACWAGGLYSGFRSELLFLVILFAIHLIMEGVWKKPLMPLICVFAVICVAPMLVFSGEMPRAIQRSLAFLPVTIDPAVRAETENSSEWRVDMWKMAAADIPTYFWIGKGYTIDPTELYLTTEAVRNGSLPAYEASRVAGDYHSGPLSVLIPFGFFGAVAFLWLIGAGLKVLYFNYKYGEANLRLMNGMLFAYFLAEFISFIFIFGSLSSYLQVFLGAVGFSVSLNRGVCRRAASSAAAAAPLPLTAPVGVAS